MTQPITSTHATINRIHAEKIDAYLIAGVINIYNEALRRKCGRILYVPQDIDRLLTMVESILNVSNEKDNLPDARSPESTDAERDQVVKFVFPNIIGSQPSEPEAEPVGDEPAIDPATITPKAKDRLNRRVM